MQPKRSPLLLATAALGVLALGGLAYLLIPHGSEPAPRPVGTGAPVAATPTPAPLMRWVAVRDIPPRTRITRDMLTQRAVVGALPKGAINGLSDVQGQLTNDAIPSGDTVTLASFTPDLKRAVPANIEVPSGFRAVAVYVDPNSTAAGLVDVGDYVDVIAVHKLTVDKEKNQIVQGALQFSAGRLIGTDLKVLAVDKSISTPVATATPTATTAAAGIAGGPPPPPPPPTPAPAANGDHAATASKIRVILAAPVDIATRLVAAQDQGTLHITIRNPIDGDQTLTPEAREYPSRVVTQREVNTSARQTGRAMGQGMMEGMGAKGTRPPRLSNPDGPPLPDMNSTPPVSPPFIPPQGPVRDTTPRAPAEPRTRDITVIRGTEKTRVIVPLR